MANPTNPTSDRRSPERKEAERLYLESGGTMKLVDIASRMGIPDSRVRKWKSLDQWEAKLNTGSGKNSKKKSMERSTSAKGNAPPKRGAPYGNKNAVGGRGNPHPVLPDNTKHGGYVPVYLDMLDDEEKAMFQEISTDPEQQLIEEIQLYSIRERRIMQAIAKYREQKGDVAVSDMVRYDTKRTFKSQEEEESYNKRVEQKVKAGDRLPGEPYNLETHTTNKDMVVARLEQELSTVQGKKNKAIDSLYKLRLERAKIESESIGSAAVDDWIAGIMGGGGE